MIRAILPLAGLVLALGLLGLAPIESKTHTAAAPDWRFQPVDTSAVLGSPDPLPMRTERAYPNLKFRRPLEVQPAPDGSKRLVVIDQEGQIFWFEDRPDVAEKSVFLDLEDKITRRGNEEGLLGLAFHPKFRDQDNGKFYVYYSRATDGNPPQESVLSEFRTRPGQPDQADPDSERVLMTIDQPFNNHNGGSIIFGNDGYLYIALGDGGSAHDPFENGQNASTLLGSILRIDVDSRTGKLEYGIPEDNPFVKPGPGVPENARGEIYALGVRNIWRITVDPQTGAMWAGDVGQDRYEEVNRIVAGGNYGWNILEGTADFEPDAPRASEHLIPPVIEYFHNMGRSITGGVVSRGKRLANYDGWYFYGDFISGNLWALKTQDRPETSASALTGAYRNPEVLENRLLARTNLQIAGFGTSTDGDVLLGAFDGYLHRLIERDIDREAIAAAFPTKLSETGLFASVPEHKPVAGAVPYDVNVPLWSDDAPKLRFLMLPEANSVTFSEDSFYKFPEGTVFVKTFLKPGLNDQGSSPQRLETRLMVHSPEGWVGYTYIWNDEQTEALLAPDGGEQRTLQVATDDGEKELTWHFPSRADCISCHTPTSGFVLGFETRQLNRGYEGMGENQLGLFAAAGIFNDKLPKSPGELPAHPDWKAGEATAEELALAYLDANCAMCHVRGGLAGGPMDFRRSETAKKMPFVGEKPRQGELGPQGTLLVRPGDPERSEVLNRMKQRGTRQMPPLATDWVDDLAVERFKAWIESIQPAASE